MLSLGLAHAQPPKFRSLDYGAVWSLSTCSLQAFRSRAARAGYKVPTLNLEFLGEFHAELTLLEYGYLPFLPSMIAASAVYMAKLTLDSSTCPWVCSFPLHHVHSVLIEVILYIEMHMSSSP